MRGDVDQDGRFVIRDKRVKDRMGNAKQIGRDSFATREEAEKAIPLYEVARNHRVTVRGGMNDGKPVTYDITRNVTDRKRVTIKDGFESEAAAKRYMVEHAVEIIETKTGFGEEILAKPETVVRKGPERRTGPATAKMFADTFGFRAVEFGNWETQGERQEVMNHAYDGLLDLAELIGVPPKAISLNGDLALAFGARGHGLSGARAHYERDRAVINLTKMQGAGALGHEWMHAVDHYFGRQDIPKRATKKQNDDGTFVFATAGREDYLSHGTAIRDSGMRKELRDAYVKMVKDLYTKAEQYVEDTAKVEKFLSRQRDEVDRTLKDMRAYMERARDWKKRNNKPATVEQLAEWDALAEKILDGGDLTLAYKNSDKKYGNGRYTNDTIEALSVIYKAVTGSAGFSAERSGSMDGLVQTMKHYKERIDQVESAAKLEEKTRRVPTSYAMEAKKIDQGRASDYWSSEHEMLARAFSAYVEDKLKADKKASEFLSFGSDNKYYVLLGIRPFPVGEERVAMGRAFDEFFRVVETKETDKGVGMFAAADGQEAHVWDEVVETAAGPIYSNGDVTLFPGGVEGAGMWENEAVYSALDTVTGKRLGNVVVGITDGQIDTLYWIESHAKGAGTRIMRAIAANSTGPVTIDNIMDTAKGFWDKIEIYDYDGRNAKLDWQSFEDGSSRALPGGMQAGADAASAARSGGSAEKGLSKEEARTYLEGKLGRAAVRRLLDSGKFTILESSDNKLPAAVRSAMGGGKTVYGYNDENGNSYLVADYLTDGPSEGRRLNAYGVFLHEVGVHYGMRVMLGERLFQSLIAEVKKASPNSELGKAAAVARKAVPKSTKAAHIDEEVLAWLVTGAANRKLSIWKRIEAKLRAFLLGIGITKAVSVDALVELARGAAMRAAGERINSGGRAAQQDGDGRFAARDANEKSMLPWKGSKEPLTPEQQKNQAVREIDRKVVDRAKKFLKRQLFPGGLLPDMVFKEKITRDSKIEVVEFDTRNLIGRLEGAIKAAYGKEARALDISTNEKLSKVLAGGIDTSVPDAVRVRLEAMRTYIDGLSKHYLDVLFSDIQAMQAQLEGAGKDIDSDAVRAKIDLFETISSNIGKYVHRSYRAFDDPKWFKSIPDATLSAGRKYLVERHISKGATQTEAERLAEIALHEILKTGTAYDSMESFIKESKLGAKDLSILKKREDIAPEIRALLGEYMDPRLSFAKSTSKMARLVFNHLFLKKVQEIGMGQFLFEGTDRPAAATKQIAADSSQAYAPLNGLWTFPHIDQAFKDALGREQMANWYRVIVQMNGFVKFGKTILSPTTAMRNWQSAAFFSIANGHFDWRDMSKSMAGIREYFTNGGDAAKLAYLRKMKRLGVVYDTPYAGEMMRLLDDSQMADWMASGKVQLTVRQGLDYAKKFYAFGDDFWKIIGFENEKRSLMKHGYAESEAETEAAERIRNTYPTYSMVGRFVNALRRFPLAGTFVSFPAEIIRTSYHMLRYTAQDFKDTRTRPMAYRRAAGLAVAASFAFAAQTITMAMFGIGDDEEEAVRDLAAPWQKNSALAFTGRDEKGNLQYFDLSFLDPYNYWKRPIIAILRDEPWQDKFLEVGREVLTPFFGMDIMAGAIFDVASNKQQGTGRPVFKANDDPLSQLGDITNHLRKSLQPGLVSNLERAVKTYQGDVSPSGKEYTAADEMAAWVGWRATTVNPRASLYYRSWEFKDDKAEAGQILKEALNDPNDISDSSLRHALEASERRRGIAYTKMIRLIAAARAAGMTDLEIKVVLYSSKVSGRDIGSIMRGETPPFALSGQSLQGVMKKSQILFKPDVKGKIVERYKAVQEMARQ